MTLPPAVAAVRLGVRRTLAAVEPGSTVVVACSGGADSLALASATVVEGRRLGLRVVGATVDHGLQAGSAEQAARVVEQLRAMGVDETVTARVRVEGAGLGPEAAARRARYDVLEQVREHFGAALVLLGHTRDDQAETVLLGLTRGSGGRALAGMRRSFDHYARPLLDVSRTETAAACAAEGLEPWDDPHNSDPGYTRVRVRTAVLPVLEEQLGPGVAEALARTADQLRADVEHLDDEAEVAYRRLRTGDARLPVAGLAELPAAVRTRVLRLAALAAGAPDGELFHQHVTAVDALVTGWRGQRWIDLPGHLRARREDGVLLFESVE
ncbi:tRNA lysidine(34) synthetase TilS [Nocardioides sp. TF02-7]|uniref:tRNA lysidine(34) synthetase TilS n=1 Tax=Nocardioides sp. TF02-7 TaxID=2917724 RepID=UPI001F0542E5|nr:tRNA lysidine(34) synthetase TilS [Nocardioides sp. TF02-7]UMG93908.1 tRNA lysidine(34) synthetase TilS [Nocardioides sp. TF02-7]